MAKILTKLTIQKNPLTRTSFVEATTDIIRSTKSITTEETKADIALENSEIIQVAVDSEYQTKRNHGDNKWQNSSLQVTCEKYHQFLLKSRFCRQRLQKEYWARLNEQILKNSYDVSSNQTGYCLKHLYMRCPKIEQSIVWRSCSDLKRANNPQP